MSQPTARAMWIGECLLKALLMGYPPGLNLALLHLIHKGAHKDMDIWLFITSSSAIAPCFSACAHAGENHQGSPWELFTKIRAIGIHYENTLLRATQQVNTQRGILFSGTVLATAAGWLSGRGETLSYNALASASLNSAAISAVGILPPWPNARRKPTVRSICRIRHYRRARRGRARFPTSLPDWLTRAASGAGQRAGLAGSAYSYVAHLNGPLR